jgi:hypothetical protein
MPTKKHVRFNPNKFRRDSDPKKTDIFAPIIPPIPQEYQSPIKYILNVKVIEEWDVTNPALTLKTTEEWEANIPPGMVKLTTEEWLNIILVQLVTVELWTNPPPTMTLQTTETFGGYSVGSANVNHSSNETGFTVDVYQLVGGSTYYLIGSFALGLINSVLFYPGRGHKSVAPTTVNGKNINPAGSETVLYSPSYSGQVAISYQYV